MLTMGTRLGPYEIVVPLTAPWQQKDEALDVGDSEVCAEQRVVQEG